MINWLKNLFAPRPVPEKMFFIKEELEYNRLDYEDPGVLEEVKDTRTPLQKALDEATIANAARLQKMQEDSERARKRNRNNMVPLSGSSSSSSYTSHYVDSTPMFAAGIATSVYAGSSYDSGSSYSSCDSGSSSCD